MKILMYCLNYAPELTGIGKYTCEQAEWLAARGHEVRVVTAPPYYPAWRVGEGYRAWQYRRERRRWVEVYRAPLWVPRKPGGITRLLHLASFAVSSLPSLMAQLRWRPDVLFVVEPPLMCAPAALLFAHWSGCKTWLHVQDYEVDAAFALGLLRRPWLRRVAQRVEHRLMTRFDRVSSISQAMVSLARGKGTEPERAALLPNWVNLREIDAGSATLARRTLGIPADAVVALYSGNMGAKQGLDVMADAARLLDGHERLHFIFCGDGAGRPALEAACAGLPQVRFLPLQPAGMFASLLAAADIHLLPQRAGAADLVMPSKLTGMLASARPVIATAEPDTELGRVVAQCGVLVPPGDAAALAAAIDTLAAQPALRAHLGGAGRRWAEQHLDRDMVLGELEKALFALIRHQPAGAPSTVGVGSE
ncbi:glycosyltransferase WbuB [Cupriavidus basilensis]|uniref:Glycosyltransferase WbuB n=1 Tax=Cupriavidus basilensis TaxID=68895 RepID=A0A643FSE5_9BURK|nr:glycosyltransferase WbuB [Cupriavidus basilensis]QOT80001.1 glycosyltransferase WbuB [Cupriavidus basilensis]